MNRLTGIVAGAVLAGAALCAPQAHADPGVCIGCWEAAANSPSKEQMDWGIGGNPDTAVSGVLAQCASLEHATDCQLLAVGPCVGIAWDGDQPINHAHGAAADTRDAALAAAVAEAGHLANQPQSRCSWDPHA
jgi:hypothetical protein